jgi:hypothetical protein
LFSDLNQNRSKTRGRLDIPPERVVEKGHCGGNRIEKEHWSRNDLGKRA